MMVVVAAAAITTMAMMIHKIGLEDLGCLFPPPDAGVSVAVSLLAGAFLLHCAYKVTVPPSLSVRLKAWLLSE